MNDRIKIGSLFILITLFLLYSGYLYFNAFQQHSLLNFQADKGKLCWQKYNCNACHQIYGLGGFLGPDLTNVYSKRGQDYIKVFLKSGTKVMPDFKLSAQEMDDLICFFQQIDSTGNSDPRHFKILSNGSIQ